MTDMKLLDSNLFKKNFNFLCEVTSDGRVNCFIRSGENECFTNNMGDQRCISYGRKDICAVSNSNSTQCNLEEIMY